MTSERLRSQEQYPGLRAAERILEDLRQRSSLAWKDGEDGGHFEYQKDGETRILIPDHVDANELEEKIEAWARDVALQRQKSFIGFGDLEATADFEGAEKGIREGDTKIVLMRNENGDAIGYAEFELRDIEPDEGSRKESFIFDWLVHVDEEYRGSGVGVTLYATAAEQCVAQARVEKKDIVAIVTSAIEVGGASFTRDIRPTYPFITDADGRTVENARHADSGYK